MRKLYETEEDRVAEAEIITEIIFGNQSAKKLPPLHEADYVIQDKTGYVVAFVEIKDRPTWRPEYRTVFMNADKWRNLVTLSESSGIPAYFAIRAVGDVFITAVSSKVTDKLKVRMFTRSDQKQSEEKACVEIPYNLFIPVRKFVVGAL